MSRLFPDRPFSANRQLSRFLLPGLLLIVGLLLSACVVPQIPPSLFPREEPSQSTIPAAGEESNATAVEPTPTPTTIELPTPGPTPTATPEPLAEPDSEQAAALTEEGIAHFLTSDLAGAEALLVEAIAADPTYLPAHRTLTDVYLYWPQYWEQALASAEWAANLAPEDPEVLAYLSWAQQGAHLFDDAWATALKAVEVGPENAIAHAAAADVLSSVYQMDEAYEHAQRAVELDPESAEVWATFASVAFALHYWDEAGNAYEEAIALEPDFFAWHLVLARYELNVTGDLEVALDLIEPARETQPDHPWILSFDVDIGIERNEWDVAEAGCTQLFAFNQPHTLYPDAYTCMAGVLILQERYADAERFQAIAEEFAWPERLDVSLLRMRLYNEQEECAEGRALAESWLEKRPYSVLSKRMIGVSYLCDDDLENAIDFFQQAVDAMPRSVGDARLLANAYARNGNASDAIAALNRVRSFAATDPLYYQALYEVHIYLGNTKEAVSAAQRWQVLRPESTDARESLALVQLFDGNTDAAQSAAKEAIDAGSVSSTVYAVYGETLSRQGRYEEAETYLLQALEREPDHFLARNFITTLYLIQEDCVKVEPHLQWLQENSDDEEEAARYAELLAQCNARANRFRPDPATALDDDAVIAEVEAELTSIGVELRSIRFSEEENQRSLVVSYDSVLTAGSEEFADQEREVTFALSQLLPRIDSQPVGMIILSGAQDEPQTFTYIATRAAFLWVTGDLTDEEFADTWYSESAETFTGE
ncbi:MAG: tetratricopeptide repeat protein [Caldilineaceae bacterium]|nr:tetratricopeptide repeat protein [Caldilineaceae bacterium]